MEVGKIFGSVSVLEYLLLETVFLVIAWYFYPYLGLLLSVVFATIILAILLISLVIELIEKSKISKKYFITLFLLGAMPIVLIAVFYMVYDGFDFE